MAEHYIYVHGNASGELEQFTLDLFSILSGVNINFSFRSPELERGYRHWRESLGVEQVAGHIEARMQGHTVAILENDFPYDALMPHGGEMKRAGGGLFHYCVWSKDPSLLTTENVDKVIDVNFSGMPALVFMHDESLKSILAFEHAHIVVDVVMEKSILTQRYFEPADFILEN